MPNNDPPRITDGREHLGDDFADPQYADKHELGHSFEDPNSIDDIKIGKSFEETSSSAKKHHRPVKEVVEAPFKKPKNRKVFFWIAGIALVLFLLILFFGWLPRHSREKETKQKAQESKSDPLIEVVKVENAKGGGGLVVPGTTTSITQASIYARANGYLKERFVDIGDHVRKGQLLAIIDAPDLDQQVDQAREQVKQAEAQLEQQQSQLALAKVTVQRYRVLVARGVFSRQEGDQREADYQAQEANVAAAVRNVEAFKANLRRVIALQSFERVTAPFDGVITQRNSDVGDLISAAGSSGANAPTSLPMGQTSSGSTQNGSTNSAGTTGSSPNSATPTTGTGAQGGALFTIEKVDRLRILVSVPEGYASMVKNGQHTTLYFQEFPQEPFYGNVSRTAASLDQNTRTMLTEIQVNNYAGRLMPGMYAIATFSPTSGGTSSLLVSGDAIAIRKDQPTVAVIANNKIKLTPVVLGRDFGPEVEIVDGLHAGDMVAATFTDDVVEGAKVKTHLDNKQEEKSKQPSPIDKPAPPGGSTQYGDPGITDQDMQGQNAKPQQKKGGGGKKASGPKGGKP